MLRTNLHESKEQYRIYRHMGLIEFDKYFGTAEDVFLHNIDTFYYSVMLDEDFSDQSEDNTVLRMREFFQQFRDCLSLEETVEFPSENAILKRLRIVIRTIPMYEFHVSFPEMFDIFIARTVPNSETPQLHVQIRSYMLWLKGAQDAYEETMTYIRALLKFFGFSLKQVQENRIDYCWHTNYFENPYRFLNIDNVAKSVVSRLTVLNQHAKLHGDEDYEIDYSSLGNIRSHKVFFRMYLKCKEVIEMNQKGFFFEIWRQKGLISLYDKEVFETCYLRQNCRWEYLYKAMLQFYVNHTPENPDDREEEYIRTRCQAILDDALKVNYDELKKFALTLVPMVTLVFNVEFATWRKFTSSFKIEKQHKNIVHGCAARIYDILDARKPILDYLTGEVVRFTKGTDKNKSRRELHPFWRCLRASNIKDPKRPEDWQTIVREYHHNLSLEKQKNRLQSSIATYSVYLKGQNEDSIMQDWIDTISSLNDNDMKKIAKFKLKKMQQLGEAAASSVVRPQRSLVLLDSETSEILSSCNYNTEDWINQDGIDDLENPGEDSNE